MRSVLLAATALLALGVAPVAAGPEGGVGGRRSRHHPGPGRPGGDRQPVDQQRNHQLEHVQHPRQRERALQSAQHLVGRAQPRDRRPGPVGDHGHADRQRPRLHHQPRRHPVRPRQRGEHRGLPRHHQRHQERRLHGGAVQFQHPGPAGCLDRQSGEDHGDERRLCRAGRARRAQLRDHHRDARHGRAGIRQQLHARHVRRQADHARGRRQHRLTRSSTSPPAGRSSRWSATPRAARSAPTAGGSSSPPRRRARWSIPSSTPRA